MPRLKSLTSPVIAAAAQRVIVDCQFENAADVHWEKVKKDHVTEKIAREGSVRQLPNNSLTIETMQAADEGMQICFKYCFD